MKKVLPIILIAIALGLILWKFPKREAEAPTLQTPAGVVSTSTIAGARLNAGGDFQYKKESEFVSIEAVYPAKTSLAGEADVRARTILENWIKARESEFTTSTTDMLDEAEQARLREHGRGYALGIEYTAYTSDNNQSFVFQIYEDTGGAHPNVYYKTFVFGADGMEVALVDLFKPSARYLDELSVLTYADILRQAPSRFGTALDENQKDWVRVGTAPSAEMFQSYYLDGENLVLIFPPYQVAAYAAGKFEVKIPFGRLTSILK